MSAEIRQRIKDIVREKSDGGDYGPDAFPDAVDAEAVAEQITTEYTVIGNAYEQVETHDNGTISCGSGPEFIGSTAHANPNWLYNLAANAVALAEHIEAQNEAQVTKNRRRDELAAEFTSVPSYGGQLPYTQRLIDRIIELEENQ